MTKPLASLSLDLDNKWSYMKTHGDRGWEKLPSYLDDVVPRFLSLLDDVGLKITVFVVGQDAALPRNHDALAAIARAGHEIGNHSFHHEPWLHLYSRDQVADEIATAEEAIAAATGVVPTGFRGPGYSLSPAVVECLQRSGYRYDASTLPTIIGPLARAYYFFTARLTADQRRQRKQLFGNWRNGLKPIRPYWWQLDSADEPVLVSARLLEIPVTTLPLFRVPIHFSYLLYLRQFSHVVAWNYWRCAMRMCAALRVEPSLLLHPLDFLGGDEEPDLGFFPAMATKGSAKRAFIRDLLADFVHRFRVLPMGQHAHIISQRSGLGVHRLPTGHQPKLPVSERVLPLAETILSAEASRQ